MDLAHLGAQQAGGGVRCKVNPQEVTTRLVCDLGENSSPSIQTSRRCPQVRLPPLSGLCPTAWIDQLDPARGISLLHMIRNYPVYRP